MTRSALILTALLATSVPVPAQPPDAPKKETPPPGGTPKDLVLAEPARITLDNGLAATLVEYGTAPKVTIYARVRAGGLNEGDDVWLAAITGDMLKEGTENYTSTALAEAAASMGGDISVMTDDEYTSVSMDVLAEFADEAVALVAEVLRRPTLPATELERIRRDYLRSLAVQQSQPQPLAQAAFVKLLYGSHPFGRTFPTEAQLAGYDIEDVKRFYTDNFGARRTQVYVAGRFRRAFVEQALRDHFGAWEPGPEPLVNVPPKPDEPGVELIARPGAPQSTLRLGLRTVDPSAGIDWSRLAVANTLFGGYFSSRVTANIREDKGYTYSPSSTLSARKSDAYWVQQADVTTEHTGDSLHEIFAELERLRAEPPSAAEVDRVQNYLVGTFTLSNSSRFGILSQLAFIDAHGLPYEYLTSYVERVTGITAEHISGATRQYLLPERMSLVVVGDLEAVRPQLEALPELEGRL